MRGAALVAAIGLGPLLFAACGGGGTATEAGNPPTGAGTTSQATSAPTFGSDSTFITNPWLPISKFHRCVLSGTDEGTPTRVVRDLLPRAKTITYRGGTIRAAVVKDQSSANGTLAERTFDYFAQAKNGDVYYLGEDVNEYSKQGQVTGHGGAWLLGRDTQTPGLLMPAHPKPGAPFRSEDVPGITHETDHVVATGGTLRIGGRTYGDVIKVREDTGPPPEVEYKNYSKGVGVITEANGGLELAGCR